jgi:hypothetical protein
MTSRDFCYWLQGYFEILDPDGSAAPRLGPKQVECIRKHLALTFKHVIELPQLQPAIQTWPTTTTGTAPLLETTASWGFTSDGVKIC